MDGNGDGDEVYRGRLGMGINVRPRAALYLESVELTYCDCD